MITNTGKRIKIDAGSGINMTRDCDTPGMVTVTRWESRIELPANKAEAESFVRAYQRIISEDIGYRESKCE